MKRSIAIFCLMIVSLFATMEAKAQELDAQVEINVQALGDVDRLNFFTFKKDMENYLNGNTWTSNYSGDRIRCTFQFNIIASNGNDYTAQMFVTSSRGLYKSDQVTTMARFFDQQLQFSYTRGEELQHSGLYRPLESVVDFYTYIIIGLEEDSYKLLTGTPYFQQAQAIAAVGNAATGRGWDRSTTSTGVYSRIGYIEDALNANIRGVRELMFHYTYDALDLQAEKPEAAREELAFVIDSLVSIKRMNSNAQRSVFFRSFFDAKYPELADLGRLFPENLNAYFDKLVYLDPLHESVFEDVKAKISK